MRFTIITSAYCGSGFLMRAFNSLLDQKGDHEFEWIIVDDYSDDEGKTKAVIEEIKLVAPFSVTAIYLDQNYYGSRSTFIASSVAKGEYGIILDQDDMLKPNALSIFSRYIESYGSRVEFAGVCARCEDLAGEFIGTRLKEKEYYSNELIVRHHDKVKGEMFQCTRIALLSQYFKDMRPGYTNGWAWNKISQSYKYLYVDEVVRVYDTKNQDSYTNALRRTRKLRHIDARYEQLIVNVSDNIFYLKMNRVELIESIGSIIRFGLHLGVPLFRTAKRLPPCVFFYVAILYPISFLKFVNDIRTKRV
ncbi:MAG TPA: glycosyltransferase family 2 protein [Pseudomonadales bacterium]|nr:glycosyltransferase family 2 protein [Pseudomonadales bacterium]